MNNEIKLAVYGTLKQGHGNYNNFMKETTFESSSFVTGFMLVGHSIPYAIYTGNENDYIIVERYSFKYWRDISDAMNMEFCAGYDMTFTRDDDGEYVVLFYKPEFQLDTTQSEYTHYHNGYGWVNAKPYHEFGNDVKTMSNNWWYDVDEELYDPPIGSALVEDKEERVETTTADDLYSVMTTMHDTLLRIEEKMTPQSTNDDQNDDAEEDN